MLFADVCEASRPWLGRFVRADCGAGDPAFGGPVRGFGAKAFAPRRLKPGGACEGRRRVSSEDFDSLRLVGIGGWEVDVEESVFESRPEFRAVEGGGQLKVEAVEVRSGIAENQPA